MTAEQACIGYAAAQQRAEQGHIRHGGIGRVDVFARRALTADRAGGCQQRARLQLRLDGGAGRDLDEGLRAKMVQLLHGDGHGMQPKPQLITVSGSPRHMPRQVAYSR